MTLLDLAVVEGYYRPTEAWNSIWIYQYVYDAFWVLIPLALAIYHKSWIPLTLPVAFFFGLEDTSFYLLTLRLPSVYVGVTIAGVYWQPSLTTVLILNAIGLALVCCMAYAMTKRNQLSTCDLTSQRQVANSPRKSYLTAKTHD